jgi:hypothetical protein
MVSNEVGHDIGDKGLETLIESVALCIQLGMSLNQPTGITGPKITNYHLARIRLHRRIQIGDTGPVKRSRLQSLRLRANSADHRGGSRRMGIDKESDIAANLQIGPTSLGMVRIYIEGDGVEIPMDFEPEEAEEIAEEIRAAAARARSMVTNRNSKSPKRK